MTIQELLIELSKSAINFVTCNQLQYDSLVQADSNTVYFTTDTGAIYRGGQLFCKMYEIGSLANLATSDKSNLVAAINEVNAKANNNTGGGVVNDSTISPFAGFLPTGASVTEESSNSTEGEVLYDSNNNRFVWKDGTLGTSVQYYANWTTSYLYNTTSDSTTTAKSNKLFSYNDAHYMVINGTLQDISNIESTLKAYTDINVTAARNYATLHINNALSTAKNYTDTQITAKIKLVSSLPSNPVADVLYLIPDE